jgi:hypothetical protein
MTGMDAATVRRLWDHAAAYLAGTGHQPARVLVLGTALLALAAVASARIWPVSRTVVTIAHEGVTGSEGSPAGLGIVLTAAAGYPAPPLLGMGAAALLATGHVAVMLILSLVLLATLAIAVRNVFGMLAVIVTGAAIAVVLWRASGLAESAFGYALTWFLLFGGVRPVLELQRTRRRGRGAATDADQLARLTGTPGWLWVGLFGVVALAAVAVSVLWLVH